MSKKGIELSVNFLVIFILTIVVFGFGIKFIYDMYGKAVEISVELDRQTLDALEAAIISGEQVAIPLNNKDIERGKTGTFGLSILNTYDTKMHFYVNVEKGSFVDPNENKLEGYNPLRVDYFKQDYWLEADEGEKIGILVKVPKDARTGTYILTVYVCSSELKLTECAPSDPHYGNVQKAYVKVP